jgi:LysR family glycine cleavage system transcriptional activator
MRMLPPLSALRAFEAAARHLSFKRAADELAVTPTAISHQMRLLEDRLGRRLFDRKAKRVYLTAAGQMLYPMLRDSFDAIARAVETVSTEKREQTIVVTATLALTASWLVPRMARFRARFPDIGVRLLASDDVVDLRAGAADLAIRFGSGSYSGCRSELLLPGTFAPVCSPTLGVRKPEDLLQQPLIHFEWRHLEERAPTWPRWFAECGRRYPRGVPKLVFSDETHAIQAAAARQGIVLASLALVAEDLESGALVQPLGPTLESRAFSSRRWSVRTMKPLVPCASGCSQRPASPSVRFVTSEEHEARAARDDRSSVRQHRQHLLDGPGCGILWRWQGAVRDRGDTHQKSFRVVCHTRASHVLTEA